MFVGRCNKPFPFHFYSSFNIYWLDIDIYVLGTSSNSSTSGPRIHNQPRSGLLTLHAHTFTYTSYRYTQHIYTRTTNTRIHEQPKLTVVRRAVYASHIIHPSLHSTRKVNQSLRKICRMRSTIPIQNIQQPRIRNDDHDHDINDSKKKDIKTKQNNECC